MLKFDERVLIILSVSVLAVHTPAEAWYKQAARPSYYSVGRASGLLAGIRRSAIRREDPDTRNSAETLQNKILDINVGGFELTDVPFCVKEVLPDPQSCELIQDSTLRCQAAVIVELKSRNCLNA